MFVSVYAGHALATRLSIPTIVVLFLWVEKIKLIGSSDYLAYKGLSSLFP